ncbi:hypothetical protein EVAR_68138_1 [Eumeta japonica]|uniref:Uncharacterized protein n=1 Tax=Eumeta variegata TaxID=151549 RepID=A0A4C2A1P1_EUMVA|nr:hypothetical protein EVAR_68138_1 [Eumeta japonica]
MWRQELLAVDLRLAETDLEVSKYKLEAVNDVIRSTTDVRIRNIKVSLGVHTPTIKARAQTATADQLVASLPTTLDTRVSNRGINYTSMLKIGEGAPQAAGRPEQIFHKVRDMDSNIECEKFLERLATHGMKPTRNNELHQYHMLLPCSGTQRGTAKTWTPHAIDLHAALAATTELRVVARERGLDLVADIHGSTDMSSAPIIVHEIHYIGRENEVKERKAQLECFLAQNALRVDSMEGQPLTFSGAGGISSIDVTSTTRGLKIED